MDHKKMKKLDGVKGTIRAVEGILEVVLLTVAYYFVWRNGYDAGLFPNYFFNGKYVLAGVYAALLFFLVYNYDGFEFGYLKLFDVVISQWIAVFIVNFITYWQLCLIAYQVITPVPLLVLMLVELVISFVCVYLYTAIYHHLYVPKNMVMIFGTETAAGLKFKMETRTDKYAIKKLIPVEVGLEKICQQIVEYDAVVISDVPAQIRNDILKFCYENQIRTYVTPKLSDIIVRGARDISLFDTPLLLVRSKGLTVTQRTLKRILDVVLCAIIMIPAAPIMLLVALAIKLEDGGPVFYKQMRMTLGGREFGILKFRSMIVDAEKYSGAVLAAEDDPRITKVGKFIRATRLDEIPQILNILKGDMSIVGPRPERKSFVDEYCEKIPEFRYRTKVKGGLTGYAQIYGKYNTSPYDKLRLDLMYIENYSLMLDIKLILMTIRIMLSKESTEGIDKAEELDRKTHDLLEEVMQEQDEQEPVGAEK